MQRKGTCSPSAEIRPKRHRIERVRTQMRDATTISLYFCAMRLSVRPAVSALLVLASLGLHAQAPAAPVPLQKGDAQPHPLPLARISPAPAAPSTPQSA